MSFECELCHKIYKTTKTLNQHLKESCGENRKKSVLTCFICDMSYNSQRNLQKHIKQLHIAQLSKEDRSDPSILESINTASGVRNKTTSLICIEEGCREISFPNLKRYRAHIQDKHNKNLTVSEHIFLTFEDFRFWKEETEKKLGITYSQQSKASNTKKIYYCRRSGKLRQRGFGTKKLKSQGSCKMGNYCLSTIEVKMAGIGDIHEVKFYEDHSGHELNVQNLAHITLPLSTKYFVASKLAENVPWKEILNLVKQQNVDERSSLINKQDIANISRSSIINEFQPLG